MIGQPPRSTCTHTPFPYPKLFRSGDMTKICMAGVTGWTGKAIAAGILDAADLALTGALARKAAGIDVGDVLGREPVGVTITADLGAALDGAEVLIDYTHPDAVKDHAQIGRAHV